MSAESVRHPAASPNHGKQTDRENIIHTTNPNPRLTVHSISEAAKLDFIFDSVGQHINNNKNSSLSLRNSLNGQPGHHRVDRLDAQPSFSFTPSLSEDNNHIIHFRDTMNRRQGQQTPHPALNNDPSPLLQHPYQQHQPQPQHSQMYQFHQHQQQQQQEQYPPLPQQTQHHLAAPLHRPPYHARISNTAPQLNNFQPQPPQNQQGLSSQPQQIVNNAADASKHIVGNSIPFGYPSHGLGHGHSHVSNMIPNQQHSQDHFGSYPPLQQHSYAEHNFSVPTSRVRFQNDPSPQGVALAQQKTMGNISSISDALGASQTCYSSENLKLQQEPALPLSAVQSRLEHALSVQNHGVTTPPLSSMTPSGTPAHQSQPSNWDIPQQDIFATPALQKNQQTNALMQQPTSSSSYYPFQSQHALTNSRITPAMMRGNPSEAADHVSLKHNMTSFLAEKRDFSQQPPPEAQILQGQNFELDLCLPRMSAKQNEVKEKHLEQLHALTGTAIPGTYSSRYVISDRSNTPFTGENGGEQSQRFVQHSAVQHSVDKLPQNPNKNQQNTQQQQWRGPASNTGSVQYAEHSDYSRSLQAQGSHHLSTWGIIDRTNDNANGDSTRCHDAEENVAAQQRSRSSTSGVVDEPSAVVTTSDIRLSSSNNVISDSQDGINSTLIDRLRNFRHVPGATSVGGPSSQFHIPDMPSNAGTALECPFGSNGSVRTAGLTNGLPCSMKPNILNVSANFEQNQEARAMSQRSLALERGDVAGPSSAGISQQEHPSAHTQVLESHGEGGSTRGDALHPPTIRPYSCRFCPSKFGRRDNMQKHMRIIHMGERPFVCEICGYAFQKKDHKDKHIRTVHFKERPHRCVQCGRCFGQKSDLSKHIRTVHERVKPFACEHCGLSFGHRGNKARHVLVVHEKRKPFICRICSVGFGERSNLAKHIMAVHKQPPDFA